MVAKAMTWSCVMGTRKCILNAAHIRMVGSLIGITAHMTPHVIYMSNVVLLFMWPARIIHHRALGEVSLPCGKWPLYLDWKNMIYCIDCYDRNIIGLLEGVGEIEESPPQDLEIPDVSSRLVFFSMITDCLWYQLCLLHNRFLRGWSVKSGLKGWRKGTPA